MKIDNINEKFVKRRSNFVVIRDIIKAKSIKGIIKNIKFAEKNEKRFFDKTTSVTTTINCRYIGRINGEDLFEWNETHSCMGNIFFNKYYITDKQKNIINIEGKQNIKVR